MRSTRPLFLSSSRHSGRARRRLHCYRRLGSISPITPSTSAFSSIAHRRAAEPTHRRQPRLRLLRPLPSSPRGAAAIIGKTLLAGVVQPSRRCSVAKGAATVLSSNSAVVHHRTNPEQLRTAPFNPDFNRRDQFLFKITEEEYLFTEEENLRRIFN